MNRFKNTSCGILLALLLVGCAASSKSTGPSPLVQVAEPAPPKEALEPAPEPQPREGEFLGPEALIAPDQARLRLKKERGLSEAAFLYIVAEPADATIFIGDEKVGEGSAFRRLTGPRLVPVRIEAKGYQPVEGYVELQEKEVVRLKVDLKPYEGRLTIVTDTPGALIFLDGEPVGKTPITLKAVPEGTRHLDLRLGSWRWEGDVIVRRGEVTLLETAIPKKPQTEAPAPKEPIVSPPPVQTPPQAPPPPPVLATPESPKPPEEKPAPQTETRTEEAKRPNCRAVCKHFIEVVTGSDSVKEPIFNRCMERCDKGDMKFAVCAWKAKDMNDVATCMKLPE